MHTNIHLRGIDEKLMLRIKKEAENQEVSMNTLILSILKKSFGFQNERKNVVYHDLDQLAGTWSKQETKQFLKELSYFEKIDEDMWK